MRGLAGARVVLVDDQISEAAPMLRAFGRVGVPIAYFDGSASSLPTPSKRLKGVRLAILDMNLDIPGSDKNTASTLVQTVAAILSPDNGPYGILVWTNHPELKKEAEDYIIQHETLPKPVFISMLTKSSFSTGTGDQLHFNVAKLATHLFGETAATSPLECLQVWEGIAFEASTNVTNSLAPVTSDSTSTITEIKAAWQTETRRLVHTISKAYAERHHSAESCIASLFAALNPLLSDRFEALIDRGAKALDDHVAGIMAATGSSSIDRRAKVNSMLHLATDGLGEQNPGNLYVFGKRAPRFMPTLKTFLDNCAEGDSIQRPKSLAELQKVSRLCALEVTPACDHAQRKNPRPRLLVGVAVPTANEKKVKHGLKAIGPFHLNGSRVLVAGTYKVFLDARFLAADSSKVIAALKPICRVRPQLLADIQIWSALQNARQGVMTL